MPVLGGEFAHSIIGSSRHIWGLRLAWSVFRFLRKTFTTLLRAHGAHSEQIMAIVGHESKEMHDHYTVPTADELRRTVGVLVP